MAAEEKPKQENIAKVLVFAPPRICFHQPYMKLRIEDREAHEPWEKTDFHFVGGKLIKTKPEDHSGLVNKTANTDTAEESCIFLEYDPELVQESVNSYLDQVFSEPRPFSTSDSCCGRNASNNSSESLSELQKEYDTVNYESQVLLDSILNKKDTKLLKEKQRTSRNILMIAKNAGESSSRKRKVNEKITSRVCFDDTHPMTDDDVYTQQQTPNSETNCTSVGNTSDHTNAPHPSSNQEARSLPIAKSFQSSSSSELSKEQAPMSTSKGQYLPQSSSSSLSKSQSSASSTKAQSLPTSESSIEGTSSHQAQKKTRSFALPKISDKLSNIADCSPGKSLVNICVVVLQVNPIKEIQIKSGRNSGQFIPLSSIIVSDTTKTHFKLTLWRQASSWTEKIVAGDIIVSTAIRIEKWRDEYIGQTTFNSSFYNLHQPQKPLSDAWLQIVAQCHLDKLMTWASNMYGYLFRKTPTTPSVNYTRISEFQNNTLVHFRGVLKSVCALTDKSKRNTYKFGSRTLPKIRAVFAQSPQEEVCVTLWGRQSEWMENLRKAEGSVFQLQYLAAKHDTLSGNMVLHTTSKSTKNKLDSESELAKPLLSLFNNVPIDIKPFGAITELLEAKFTGSAEISGDIHSFSFRFENETLEVKSHDAEALGEWCHRLTYVGCASCSRALKQDENKIYGQCSHCVYRKPGYNYAVKHYFRNLIINVKDKDSVIEVEVNQKSACKLFEGVDPEYFCLGQTSNASSPKVREFITVVKELLSCNTPKRFIMSCKTVVDDNSFVISRSFELLNFKIE